MAIEIVDFPIKNSGSSHSYVSHNQRVAYVQTQIQEAVQILFRNFGSWEMTSRPGNIGYCDVFG